MKKIVLYLCFMLIVVLPLLGVAYEQTEEYAGKQAILNEKAARFKAETGFKGDISYNYQNMKFSNIIGNFQDIVVSAPQDTVVMRQVFDQVVAKVMPFVSARDGQLLKGKVVSNIVGTRIIYWQIINGYRIEAGEGSLRIGYNLATCQFSIMDATVDITSDIVPIKITLKQAMKKAQDDVFDGAEVKPYNHRIAYAYAENSYYLCYVLICYDYTICVDVSNSVIRKVSRNKVSNSDTGI